MLNYCLGSLKYIHWYKYNHIKIQTSENITYVHLLLIRGLNIHNVLPRKKSSIFYLFPKFQQKLLCFLRFSEVKSPA